MANVKGRIPVLLRVEDHAELTRLKKETGADMIDLLAEMIRDRVSKHARQKQQKQEAV